VQGSALRKASREGDLILVNTLLEHQPHVNSTDVEADVNSTDVDGNTALDLAGNYEEIKCSLLLSGRLHLTPQSMVDLCCMSLMR